MLIGQTANEGKQYPVRESLFCFALFPTGVGETTMLQLESKIKVWALHN